jgi:hypothetical protein
MAITDSSRDGALRRLAWKVKETIEEAERKVKKAVEEAEREKLWAKLRETDEYVWTVDSRKEEEGFLVVEGKV